MRERERGGEGEREGEREGGRGRNVITYMYTVRESVIKHEGVMIQ